MNDPMTCIHQQQGLCPQCEAEYDEDPLAWFEFGRHPEGIARWEALQREMAEDASRASALPGVPDPDMPL